MANRGGPRRVPEMSPTRAMCAFVASCDRFVNARHTGPPRLSLHTPRPCQLSTSLRRGIVKRGANRSGEVAASFCRYTRMRALADVTSETLRRWRQARGWDVPRMARELRKAARDSGEDVAAHHGLVKMIPQWERGDRAPRERYRLLYLKIFTDALRDQPHVTEAVDLALRVAEVRSRAASLPGPGEIRVLEASALTRPRESMAPAEIRALAEEAIAHLHEVADKLAELSALLDDKADGGKP